MATRVTTFSRNPAAPTKDAGSTVSRLLFATTLPAVKYWFTVSTTRRSRFSAASAWSARPLAQPEKLTNKWWAAQ